MSRKVTNRMVPSSFPALVAFVILTLGLCTTALAAKVFATVATQLIFILTRSLHYRIARDLKTLRVARWQPLMTAAAQEYVGST